MSQALNLFTEVLNFVTSVGCFEGSGNTDHCPGSVLHPVTAALATQGYWVHADIIWHLRFTNFQTWAILIYLVACIGAICGMAFGAPPKLWIWLLVGPGIFLFLIDTTQPTYGVRWYVGPNSNDIFGGAARDERAMRRVWKLSEVGIANSSVAIDANNTSFIGSLLGFGGDLTVYNDGHPVGTNRTTEPGDPSGTVRVAWLFLWADWVFSDFVEWVVWWTGLFNSGVGAQIGNITRSNLPLQAMTDASGLSFLTGGITDNTREDDQAWLLSKNKWSYLMDITGAQLHNGDLRDSFVTMMSSECGDALRSGIDESSYVAAINAKGMNLPASVFKAGTNGGDLYSTAMTALANTHIPTPPAVAALFDSDGQGSFRRAMAFMRDPTTMQQWKQSGIMETIACDQLLNIVVEGFRWEAAHVYYQLLTSLPPEMSPLTLMYTLFYGWDMKSPGTNIGIPGWNYDFWIGGDLITPLLTPDDQAEFLQNLIFLHLVRNELQLAPKPFRGRVNEGQKAVQDVNTYQARTGSRNKYGEVYTWSMMIPYIQGVLMYLMAIAYPFICMMILIPGRSKALLTWLSFFVWTKLWDIGFAVVMVLERSIWAMLGNGPNTGRVFSRVIDMANFGDYQVECPDGGTAPPIGLCTPGTVPDIMVGRDGNPEQALYMNEIFRYFDQGLTVGGNLQLDLANSYYIYIMSALYFAVPAVTGQMVLGAKAGAAGLASGAIGGLASESGRAAGQGYTAGQSRIAGNNNGMVSYNERNQAMRQAGLAGQALDAGNNALASGLTAQAYSAADNFAGQASRVDNLSSQRTQAQNNETQGRVTAVTAPAALADLALNQGLTTAQAFFSRNLGNLGRAGAGNLISGGASKVALDAWSQSAQIPDSDSNPSASDMLGQNSLMRSLQPSTSGSPSVDSQSGVTSQNGRQTTTPAPSNTNPQPPRSNNGNGNIQAGAPVGAMASGVNNTTAGGTQAANAAVTGSSMNRQVGWEMGQNAAKLGSNRAQMDKQVWERASSGLQNFAETQAALAGYGGVRDFQEGTADYLGAIGGNSGVVSGASGSLANLSMNGLAAAGQLGKPNRERAILGMGGEVNGTSFFGYNNAVNQQLDSNFGPRAVAAQYNAAQGHYSNVSNTTMQGVPNAQDYLGQPRQAQQQKTAQNSQN
jgi:hypothetical protein